MSTKQKLSLSLTIIAIFGLLWWFNKADWEKTCPSCRAPIDGEPSAHQIVDPQTEPILPYNSKPREVPSLLSDAESSTGVDPNHFKDLMVSINQTSEITAEQEQWAFSLSDEQQKHVAEDYRQVSAENRSSRGVRVYLLIQQKVASPSTHSFLKEVLREPRCLSLDDCTSRMRSNPKHLNQSVEAAKGALHDRDHSVPQATLDYPQLMVLKGIELNGRSWPLEEKTRWIEILTELKSKNPEWSSKYDNALRALQN